MCTGHDGTPNHGLRHTWYSDNRQWPNMFQHMYSLKKIIIIIIFTIISLIGFFFIPIMDIKGIFCKAYMHGLRTFDSHTDTIVLVKINHFR